MSAEQPDAVNRLLAQVDWQPASEPQCSDDLLYATHSGVFYFAGHKLRCYRLNDGRAIFHADDFNEVFGELLNLGGERG